MLLLVFLALWPLELKDFLLRNFKIGLPFPLIGAWVKHVVIGLQEFIVNGTVMNHAILLQVNDHSVVTLLKHAYLFYCRVSAIRNLQSNSFLPQLSSTPPVLNCDDECPQENNDVETDVCSCQANYKLADALLCVRITWVTDKEVDSKENQLDGSFIDDFNHVVLSKHHGKEGYKVH